MKIAIGAVAVAAGLAVAGCSSSPGSSAPSAAPRSSTSAPAASSQRSTASRPPTAEQIAARMHLHHVRVITAANDPNHLLGRQGGYTSDVDDGPTYSPGSRGSIGIEVYPDAAGARARVAYLRGFAGTILGDGYDYRIGGAILRLDSHYTPAQARAYRAAFAAAVSQ
jgi:hypothetical protein